MCKTKEEAQTKLDTLIRAMDNLSEKINILANLPALKVVSEK